MTSSAFSLSSFFAKDSFKIEAGTAEPGGLHGGSKQLFCPHCKSWLFTYPEGFDEIVIVRSMLLDDSEQYRPFVEVNTESKLPWVVTSAKHSFSQVPSATDFQNLLLEFAS